jgi:hypothetical protein
MFIETIPLTSQPENLKREYYDSVLAQTFGAYGELANIDWIPGDNPTKQVSKCTVEEIIGYNFKACEISNPPISIEEVKALVNEARKSGIPKELTEDFTNFQANILSGPGWVSYDFYFIKNQSTKMFYVVIIDDDVEAVKFKLLL